MPKRLVGSEQKNLIGPRLIEIREAKKLSQRDLSRLLMLAGYDIDRNVITRIETRKRYVTDIELKAFSEILDVPYDYLIDGNIHDKKE